MVHTICGGQVFPGGKFVSVLSKDLLNLEPPLYNLGYALGYTIKIACYWPPM